MFLKRYEDSSDEDEFAQLKYIKDENSDAADGTVPNVPADEEIDLFEGLSQSQDADEANEMDVEVASGSSDDNDASDGSRSDEEAYSDDDASQVGSNSASDDEDNSSVEESDGGEEGDSEELGDVDEEAASEPTATSYLSFVFLCYLI